MSLELNEAAWWFKECLFHPFESLPTVLHHGVEQSLLLRGTSDSTDKMRETWTGSRVRNFEWKHTWPSISYIKACSNTAHKVLFVSSMLINTEWHSRPGLNYFQSQTECAITQRSGTRNQHVFVEEEWPRHLSLAEYELEQHKDQVSICRQAEAWLPFTWLSHCCYRQHSAEPRESK